MEGLISGLSHLGGQQYWLAFFTAVSMAAIAGLLPGISASLLMALAIPFIIITVQDPVIGIVMLATITAVEEMLDVLPIVALGHPGGGQVTFMEARPLSSRGYAARVLGFVYMVSLLGGLIGACALLLVIPIIKPFILQFSFAEIGVIGLIGVVLVGALSRGAIMKGIAAGAFGMMLSTVGLSVFTGETRYTFDLLPLREGLPLIATTIGLFALPEMIDLMLTRKAIATGKANISTIEVFRGAWLALRYWKLIVRHSLLGVFLGAIPGIGARIVSWLSYGVGISATKNKNQFGKGSYRGLVFSESVQSSKEGGQAIPTLALGIPGGQSWVFVLVAMIAYGISPGPQMLTQHGDIITLIVVSMVLGNAVLALIGMLWSGQLARLTQVPYPLLGAVIIPLAFLSAYQETPHWSVVLILLIFAALGLLMKQYKWPRPPLILGFILGKIIEENLLSAHSLYGTIGILQRPLTIVLLVLLVIVAFMFSRISDTSKTEAAINVEQGLPPPPPQRGWRWTWANLFPLFFIAIAAYFIYEATHFRPKAAGFPILLAAVVILMSLGQIVANGFNARQADVLDLGMLSDGVEDRNRSALLLAGLTVIMLSTAVVFGLQYGAIAFALLAPAFLMTGRRPWAWGIVSGSIIAVLVFFFFTNLLGIVWPEPLLGDWVQTLFALLPTGGST